MEDSSTQLWSLVRENHIRIGESDLMVPLREEFPEAPTDAEDRERLRGRWTELVKDFRIRFGTLLKSDAVSVLLGAGTSRHAGGPVLHSIPLVVERHVVSGAEEGTLEVFYGAIRSLEAGSSEAPANAEAIAERRQQLNDETAAELRVNVERLLSLLHVWRAGLGGPDAELRIEPDPSITAKGSDLDAVIGRVTGGLALACVLPADGAEPADPLRAHRQLLKKLLARPLNLKRASVFTLNYDTLVEQSADAEGLVISDGFTGNLGRVFRPESYDHDFYFPAETTEGRVHRLDRVFHLYKLHGSVTWRTTEATWENPYGIAAATAEAGVEPEAALIYPTPAKYGEMLGMPYAELFRRFASTVIRPQAVLVVMGYSFRDDHVLSIVRQALTLPSFRLVVVDPSPDSDFVERLRAENDQRVWIVSGRQLGTFEGFVDELMPELTEEEILRKVMATHRALAPDEIPGSSGGGTDGE